MNRAMLCYQPNASLLFFISFILCFLFFEICSSFYPIMALTPELKNLQLQTGYNIVQENGQRKTGPPPFWTGPPPPKGCEIFIGKIPRNIFEDTLFPIFSAAGVIYELRLMMDFSSSNRGYAFITYTNKRDARTAIRLFNGLEICPGRRIGVILSKDNCTLFIEGISQIKSELDIYEELIKYTPNIVDVTVYTSPTNKFKNMGFAFIEYESHRAACEARKILVPGDVKLFDHEITVDWAEPPPTDANDEQARSVPVLLVRNVPITISESTLLSFFSFQGNLPIVKFRRLKNIAYINFVSQQDAEAALNKLNGVNISGQSIQVTWAKPPVFLEFKEKPWNFTTSIQPKTLSGFDSFAQPNKYSERKLFGYCPVKVLSQICQANGWGDPVYNIVVTSSSADESETFYSAKVFIPNFPCPQKLFGLTGFFFSIKEAKNCIAEHALRSITPFQNCLQQVTYEMTNPNPKIDLSSSLCIWNPPPPISQMSSKNESLQQVTYEIPNSVPNIDLSSSHCIWNPPPPISQMSSKNEILNQDTFLNLMASAASLANTQLQSKVKPNQCNPNHFLRSE